MPRRILVTFAVAMISGCALHTVPSDAETLANLVAMPVTGVDARDGIDQTEAKILATDYFYELISFCGSIRYRAEDHDLWFFSVGVGYENTPSSDIVVRKDGAGVYHRGGPDLYWMEGSWVYDKRKRPYAELDKMIAAEVQKKANQSSQSTPSAVTPPAGQEARQP